MTGSITAEPVTLLDQQTVEELQPPCEARFGGGTPCDQAATWAVWVSCGQCGERLAIDCDYHHEVAINGQLLCRRCHEAGRPASYLAVKRAERL